MEVAIPLRIFKSLQTASGVHLHLDTDRFNLAGFCALSQAMAARDRGQNFEEPGNFCPALAQQYFYLLS